MKLNTKAAADYLDRSKSWLQHNRAAQDIPALKIGGRYEFDSNELDLWRAEQRVSGVKYGLDARPNTYRTLQTRQVA